ncbi:MAG: tetraacyldisaccharide 4'-kinase [Ignavibacteriales bacterium]|nr:MAG: tetraacyldisaccharide 4'-kinase [Ignavibacteriales bacterium]
MDLLKFILLPFVPVYSFVMYVRNLFFDKGIFKSTKVNAKVISVGNITVGGSGKTPTVIYLSNLLKNESLNVGVLSRGYGRKSSGYLLVSDGKSTLTEVSKCGDEIYQTAIECKVPAAVSENRVKGSEKFIRDTNVKVIILDDAYQHRWIYRDINVLICEQRFLTEPEYFRRKLLPAGSMRESFKAISRADLVIINRKFSEQKEIPSELKKYFEGKKIFTAKYKAVSFVDVKKKTSYDLQDFEGQKSLVVSGVANPFSFLNALKQTRVETVNKIIFRDHKNYTLKEVQRIRKEFYATNSHSVVTTEKDAVKLSMFSKELDDIDIFYLKIEIVPDDEKSFRDFIINKLT